VEFSRSTFRSAAHRSAGCLQPEEAIVLPGDVNVARAFVARPFDHLIYTGSTEIGRHVMRVAAEHLVPVTLELGGKSPAIVAPDADITEAARDIIFGKLLNAGQICISPDYALVPRARVEDFAAACQAAAQQMFAEGTASPDYTSIINEHHLGRLQGYYDTLDEAIGFVNARPRPLALYLFAKSNRVIDKVLHRTVCGSVSINDTLTHCAVDDLPFGGVGASGMGHYHGREGFETLSKLKPIFRRTGFRTDRFARPPFTNFKKWLIGKLI
jgi:coniferyl-aldehyde dehydrogenase